MNADPVTPLLMQQVVKTLMQTSELKDSPFAALLETAISEEASK